MSSHAQPAVSPATKEESPPPPSLTDRLPSENMLDNEMSARAADTSESGDSDGGPSDHDSSEQRIRELNRELLALNRKVAAIQSGMRRSHSRGRRRHSSSRSSGVSPYVSPVSPVRRARRPTGSNDVFDEARERWELERARKELERMRQENQRKEEENMIRRKMELERLEKEEKKEEERRMEDMMRRKIELERLEKERKEEEERRMKDMMRRKIELERREEEEGFIRKSGREGFVSISRDTRVARKVNESRRRNELIDFDERKKMEEKAFKTALVEKATQPEAPITGVAFERRRARPRGEDHALRLPPSNYPVDDRPRASPPTSVLAQEEAMIDGPGLLLTESALEGAQRLQHGPRNLVPVTSQMEWSAFRMANNPPGLQVNLHDLPALDILVEEPALLTELETSMAHRPQDGTRGGSNTVEKSEASTVLSQTALRYNPTERPLPERIRVRSPMILQFLTALLPGFPQRSLDPKVLIRPYRALAHYYSMIRDVWCFSAAEFDIESPRRRQTDDKLRETFLAKQRTWLPDETWDGSQDVMAHQVFGHRTPKQALRHVECLIEFMDEFLMKKINSLTNADCHKVFFVDLWHIFKPGDFVISRDGRQVYRILSITSTGHRAAVSWNDYSTMKASTAMSPGTEMPIRILCVHIDYDGVQLGPVPTEFIIKKYEGEKAIGSLEIRPAHLDRNPFQRERFVTRGRRFLQAASIQHLHYAGFTLETRDEVDSQVVVDFTETFAAPGFADWKPEIEPLIGTAAFMPNFEACEAACCKDDFIFYDDYVEQARDEAFMETLVPPKWEHSKLPSVAVYPRTLEEAKTPGNSLTDDELLIMSYRVFGFVLSSRKWAKLDLECLKPVGSGNMKNDDESVSENVGAVDDDTEASFDQLVLPKGHKEMVLSLVAQHFRNKETVATVRDQFDIVRGKGKGLIILLHGAPGVGKTSTAECVAELFEKPLFQITCGDLGTTAKEVEASLEMNFALANKWGCILLIDEADVFLARRTSSDFTRNGLVAVFLRVLEHYAGILFLTTNRVGDFDEAFTSRIHISLHYPPLDDESTEAVFRVNLKRILKRFREKGRIINIEEVKICVFARMYWQEHFKARWNGRQIRNACQTALALSEFESQGGMSVFEGRGAYRAALEAKPDISVHLRVDHFKTVAQAYLSFMSYLDDIYGVDADTRAKENFLRTSYKDYPAGLEAMNPLLGSSRWKGKTAWDYQTRPAPPAAEPQGPQQHRQKAGYTPYGQPGVPMATTGRENLSTAQRPTQPWNSDGVDAYQNHSAYLASHRAPPAMVSAGSSHFTQQSLHTAASTGGDVQRPPAGNSGSFSDVPHDFVVRVPHQEFGPIHTPQYIHEQQPWQHVPQGHGGGFSPNTQAGGGSLAGEALLGPTENSGNLQ